MAIWGSVVDKLGKWWLSVAGVVTAAFSIYLYGRSTGSARAQQKAAEADQKQAKKVEDNADKARASDIGDPAEFLRRRGRLRSDD
jgi:uncharacterized membrane protein YdjX (TVP38/TMEM64 family)